ncbi:MAG TPA: ATP synthase F0 subunit B [Terriglobia bacterium]|jgi:F-type H+-transporting ATPase subunit b|nr:ATP synthase F0 subunit B [Terriglobia bacterium]
MGQIFSQLGQLLVQSIPTIVIVLFLVAFLNRLFFKPLSQTLDARTKATTGAITEAREQAERAESKLRDYEKAMQAARQEIYQHREDARRKGLEERDRRIREARDRAEAMVKEAQASLENETAMVKAQLRAAAEALAAEVAESLFAPRAIESGQGGLQA